jgi:ribose 1,5-bisphosphokinase PhnN
VAEQQRVLGTAARKPPLRDTLLWATLSLAHRFKLEGILSTRVDVLPKQRGREAQKIIVDRLAFGAELADDRPDVQRIPSNDGH